MRQALALALLLAPSPVLAQSRDNSAALAGVATGFYAVYAALHVQGGGIPDGAARARYAPYLSARLNRLLNDGAAAEARFHAKVKNAPPLIEGDLFTSLFEGATATKITACSGDDKSGTCQIALTHADPGQKPAAWKDRLLLVNTPIGWKIDDIAYDAGFAFGNSGRLSETLKFVLASAP